MLGMGKKKSGKHSAPRKPVQFPSDWLAVAHQLAKSRPIPTVWFLVQLVQREALEQGIKNLPPMPWE